MKIAKSTYTTLIYLILLLLIADTVQAQCRINETQRSDGRVSYQAPGYVSGPLAGNDDIQVVLMPIIIGKDYSVAGFVRWRNLSQSVSGPIRIILESGQALRLPLFDQREMRTGGSNVTSSLYEASAEELRYMMETPIKTVNIQIEGTWNILKTTSREDEFRGSLDCLQRETGLPLK